jgi:MFS family permease
MDHQQHLSRPREALLIVTLSATQALQEACLRLVIAASPSIGESLGVASDKGQLSWFAGSYALTVGTFVFPAGRWGDLYGHKLLLLVGWAWFAVWSVVAGLNVQVGFIFLLHLLGVCLRSLGG